MTSGHRLVALALLAGCNGGLSSYNPDADTSLDETDEADADTDADSDADSDADTDTDADADLDPLSVDGVEPAWGSNAGGSTVTITGGPFDDSAEVFFVGASETVKGTVQSTSSNEIVAKVPASDEVGSVDVKVVTDTRKGTATGAFTYWADGSGKIGVLGAIEWYKYVGSYWNGTPVDFGSAALMFVEPTSESYRTLYYARSLDRCESGYAGPSTDVYAYETGADQLKLSIPTGGLLTLEQHASYAYYYELPDKDGDGYANDLRAVDFKQGAAYGLEPILAAGFPEFTLETFVQTPEGIQVTAPALTGSTVPTVPRNFTFSWDTGTPGDYMLAVMYRYDASGATAETVTCAMNDDGSFQVPTSAWTGWTSGEQITILLGRAVEGGDTLPYNDAVSGMVGIHWVIGAAWQQ